MPRGRRKYKPTKQQEEVQKRKRLKVKDALDELNAAHCVEVQERSPGLLRVTYTFQEETGVAFYYPGTGKWWYEGRRHESRYAENVSSFFDQFAPGALRREDLALPFPDKALRAKERDEAGRAAALAEATGGEVEADRSAEATDRTTPREPRAGESGPGRRRGEAGAEPGLAGRTDWSEYLPFRPSGSVEGDWEGDSEDAEVPKRLEDLGAEGEGAEGAGASVAESKPVQKGYILKKVVRRKEQADLVHDVWLATVEWSDVPEECERGYPDAGVRFLAHVIATGARQVREREGWVYIPARLIERTFAVHRTDCIWRPLQRAGLLEVLSHITGERTREFRLPPHLRDEFVKAGVGAGNRAVRWDLVKNQRDKAKATRKPHGTDRNGQDINLLIKNARVLIWETGCLFDVERAVEHVSQLERDRDRAEAVWESAGAPKAKRNKLGELLEAMSPEEYGLLSARSRWHQDSYCLEMARLPDPVHVRDTVWRYRPRFIREPQVSGRITEEGGFQSASRELKQAALGNLMHLGVRNYDMRSSQVHGLIQLFEDADVDPAWLNSYLDADKADYAERAFGTRSDEHVDLWKKCLLALFMGAALPQSTEPGRRLNSNGNWETIDRDVARYIRDAFGQGWSTPKAEAALASFSAVVGEFDAARRAWHEHLAGPYIEEHAAYGRGGLYVKNAVGETMQVDVLQGWELKSKLAAHLLQGLEAEFIHHLTLLGPVYDFGPMSNQHDGLVTEGEVPSDAVDEALSKSQLRKVQLIEKPFV